MKYKVPVDLSIVNAPSKQEFLPVISTPLNKDYLHIDLLSDGIFLHILKTCKEWVSHESLIQLLLDSHSTSREECEEIINQLLDSNVLVSDEDPLYTKVKDYEENWVKSNWKSPLGYHIIANRFEKTNYWDDPEGREDQERMRQRVKEEAPPSQFKEYKDSKKVPLNYSELNSSLENIFNDYVGDDKAKESITREELGSLIYYSFGKISKKRLPVTGLHICKTSPSGGSRHPTETYVIIHNVKGLQPGLYHYNVRNHELEQLYKDNLDEFVQQHVICNNRYPSFDKKVTFIHSTVFDRSMHRYREPRSYRAINHDIGHLMQTTALLASAMGMNSYRGYSMHDMEVEKLIGVDGIYESAMTFTIVG
jgi:SagB-type dehydrogenase family enzyme